MSDRSPSQALSTKTLLVISHRYNTFVKSQVDELATYYDRVVVLVRYNPFVGVLSRVYPNSYRNMTKARRIETETPANVTVSTTTVPYPPIRLVTKRLGSIHAALVLAQLRAIGVDVDLVHAHFTWTAGAAGVRVADWLDVPCVITSHLDHDELVRQLDSDLPIEDVWRRADAVIRVTDSDTDLVRRYCNDVRYIPNGYDRDRFPVIDPARARAELGVPTDVPIVFSLGQLIERKGQADLIRAIDRLERQVNCVISGEGERLPALRKLVVDLGLEESVRLTGYVSDREAARWMNACDVFALPSYSEGTPTVLFEALGCGKPYVGTPVGGIGDIVSSSELGCLHEPGNVEQLAGALRMALDTEWDADRIRTYSSSYTWENVCERIVQLHECVGPRRRITTEVKR